MVNSCTTSPPSLRARPEPGVGRSAGVDAKSFPAASCAMRASTIFRGVIRLHRHRHGGLDRCGSRFSQRDPSPGMSGAEPSPRSRGSGGPASYSCLPLGWRKHLGDLRNRGEHLPRGVVCDQCRSDGRAVGGEHLGCKSRRETPGQGLGNWKRERTRTRRYCRTLVKSRACGRPGVEAAPAPGKASPTCHPASTRGGAPGTSNAADTDPASLPTRTPFAGSTEWR
jgi:hypothetical protein